MKRHQAEQEGSHSRRGDAHGNRWPTRSICGTQRGAARFYIDKPHRFSTLRTPPQKRGVYGARASSQTKVRLEAPGAECARDEPGRVRPAPRPPRGRDHGESDFTYRNAFRRNPGEGVVGLGRSNTPASLPRPRVLRVSAASTNHLSNPNTMSMGGVTHSCLRMRCNHRIARGLPLCRTCTTRSPCSSARPASSSVLVSPRQSSSWGSLYINRASISARSAAPDSVCMLLLPRV